MKRIWKPQCMETVLNGNYMEIVMYGIHIKTITNEKHIDATMHGKWKSNA